MGYHRCHAGHIYAIETIPCGRPSAEEIDEWCPDCHNDDALLYIELSHAAFVATTFCTDELFEDGGLLHAAYQQIYSLRLDEKADLRWEFERRAEGGPSRQGIVLAYIAQVLLNMGLRACEKFDDGTSKHAFVVVVGLAFFDYTPYFFIGVNGHDSIAYLSEHFLNALPKTIYGISCVFVVDDIEPQPEAIAKRLTEVPQGVSAWSWHGEQKVLKRIKNLGIEARRTATCLGIAHRAGPCHKDTAGDGTNHCYFYLREKFEKDERRISVGGDALVTVSAYWYAWPENTHHITKIE